MAIRATRARQRRLSGSAWRMLAAGSSTLSRINQAVSPIGAVVGCTAGSGPTSKGGGGSPLSATQGLPSGLVTFLFTDIEGSTRLAQLLGAGYRTVLAEHREILRRAVKAEHGAELFTEGDSVFAAFPDANGAIRACIQAQLELAAHPWPHASTTPRVRMGLHSGFAEPAGGEYATPEVHRASRVASAAHGGQILCSGSTER